MYLRIMASSATQPLDPFGSALRTVRDALAEVADQPTWSVSDAALPDLIQAADVAASAVAEIGCRLVAEAHSRNIAGQQGASSTAAWLDRLTGCGRPEAGQVTRTSRRLANRYELVRVALAAGRISLAKAHVIRVALDRCPPTCRPTHWTTRRPACWSMRRCWTRNPWPGSGCGCGR
jgi:hypothetical protein